MQMSRSIINVLVGLFVLVMFVLALVQDTGTWATALLGVALGAMVVIIFPWHAEGSIVGNARIALAWIGTVILAVLLVIGLSGDWSARESGFMGVAVGAALVSALQVSSRNRG